MRHLLLATTGLATTMLVPLTANADTIEATSAVSRVTVYTDGATISRRRGRQSSGRANTVVLRGLPAGLDPNSIRVDGIGQRGARDRLRRHEASPGDPRPATTRRWKANSSALRAERDSLAGALDAAEGQKAAISVSDKPRPKNSARRARRWKSSAGRTPGAPSGGALPTSTRFLRDLREKSKTLGEEIARIGARDCPHAASRCAETRHVHRAGERRGCESRSHGDLSGADGRLDADLRCATGHVRRQTKTRAGPARVRAAAKRRGLGRCRACPVDTADAARDGCARPFARNARARRSLCGRPNWPDRRRVSHREQRSMSVG